MTVLEWRIPGRAQANVWVASLADETLLRATVLDGLAHAACS
jgi:hypothetical protein